mmetsp:Transcript_27223/g.36378  ORF Transcript_27223/g.36378 Transcript_27223/m.36378 type:complete len:268 (-) Transcript_27223:1187-1990(-)
MDTTKKTYLIKPEYPEPISIKYQMAAINGQFGLGKIHKSKYANAAHFDLISKIVPLRIQFRKTHGGQKAQQELAKAELDHWLTYMERRKEQCDSQIETQIPTTTLKYLKDAFDRLRDRNTQRVKGADLIEAHSLFAKGYEFRIPINPRNMSQMIHPHQGYMVAMPNRGYTWEEMEQMYRMQVLASHEKSCGRTLHGEELSALAFWLLVDTEREGSICDLERLRQLMVAFHFSAGTRSWFGFKREHNYSIVSGEMREGKEVLRFDLMR